MTYCLPSAGRAGHRKVFSGARSFIRGSGFFLASCFFRGCDIHAEE
jgi:hypothetical protein